MIKFDKSMSETFSKLCQFERKKRYKTDIFFFFFFSPDIKTAREQEGYSLTHCVSSSDREMRFTTNICLTLLFSPETAGISSRTTATVYLRITTSTTNMLTMPTDASWQDIP